MATDDAPEPPVGAGPAQVAPWLRSRGQSLDPTRSNWCGAFTNASLAEAGIQGLQKGGDVATNWMTYGAPAAGPVQPNDVVVLPRGRAPGALGGHVGVATGNSRVNPATGQVEVEMKAGNDAGNRVALSWQPTSQVVIRRGTQVADAPSAEELLTRMQKLAPTAAPQTATDATATGGSQAAPEAAAPSSDALMARMKAIAPPTQETKAATPATRAPSFADAYGHTQSVDEYGNAQTPLAAAPAAPTSLEDLRDKLQAGEINVLKRMAGGPDTGPVEGFLRQAAAVPVHMAFGAAQLPINALIGLGQGPSGAVTINPETGTMGLTPEAMTATQLLTMGGPAGRDVRFSGGNPLEFVPPTGTFDRGPPIPPETAANLLSPEAKARAAEVSVPGSPQAPTAPASSTGIEPPPPPPPPPGPQAAGAQITPTYEAIHTPAEEAAYRANAEGQKLIEAQKIGEPDRNQYIPGETANRAEQEQTENAARELKALGIRTPEAGQAAKEAAESNDTARKIYLENTSKGQVDIHNRTVDRERDINADKATVFAPENVKGPVDFEPVIAHMEDVLNQPMNRQNSALQAVYRPLLERIKNANISDPMEAWGLRRDIDRLTSKRAQSDDRNLHEVAHDLNEVSGVIDKQIEDVAPGYDAMLEKYKEHSRAIDEMTVLQKAMANLRGPGQRLTFSDFQRFMKGVVNSRMTPSFDLNPYKAISPENMTRLWNVRDSLRRAAGAVDLAKAAGSDTMPNIFDAMRAYTRLGVTGGAHLVAGHLFGPGGNIALDAFRNVARTVSDVRTRARDVRQMEQMLNPPTPLRVPPGQENPLSGAPPP